MAAELEQAWSVEPKLVEGSQGIFDVKVDGRLVFSKARMHRFPNTGELVRLVRAP